MKKVLVLLLVVCLIFSVGCAPKQAEEIVFVLDWTPNTNHTGLFVALEKGWFPMEVTVVQPPEDGAEVLVGAGRAQFGVSFQDYMAPALVGDEPLPITAVAAVIQHNTSGILSRKGEGMDRPAGMEGKKYATWDLPVETETLRQVISADGGDFEKVVRIPSTVTDEVSALQTESVDAIWVYEAWGGVACDVAGVETDFFAFADLDPVFDYYTPVIIANNEFLQNQPETARAFLAALKQGYEFAMEHPEEAADILMKHAPELSANPELVYESQRYLASRYQTEAARWGEMEESRWAAFFSWLSENGLVEGDLSPTAGFTNEFLPE